MKPRRDPDPSREDLPLVPVRGEMADAVHAVASTAMFASLAALFGPDALDQEEELLEGARDLSRMVVARVLEHPQAPSSAAVRDAAQGQEAAIRELAEGPAAGLLPDSLEGVPKEVLGEVSAFLREAGLEEHETDVMLATHEEQGLLLTTRPVTPAQAHVWLLGSLYERIEDWISGDEVTALERGAARWWFERWTPSGRQPEHAFARGVREQEFSLVDRPFLALQDLTAVEFMAETGELEDYPRKQRHMALQLRESVAGVWEVREREGERTLLVPPLGGPTATVHEHAPEHPYGPGALALGRLIPFGDGTWLRSPGMLLVPDSTPEQTRAMAAALSPAAGELPDAIKVEAMVTTLTARTKLPRRVLPAPGVREAAQILQVLPPLLLDAGIARELTPDELPPEVDRSRLPEGPLYDYEVDIVLSDWIEALSELARKAGGGKAGKRKKDGRRGRRR